MFESRETTNGNYITFYQNGAGAWMPQGKFFLRVPTRGQSKGDRILRLSVIDENYASVTFGNAKEAWSLDCIKALNSGVIFNFAQRESLMTRSVQCLGTMTEAAKGKLRSLFPSRNISTTPDEA